MLHDNIGLTPEGNLSFGGFDAAALAREYGTPLYLVDEARVRRNCRRYTGAMAAAFGAEARPYYAGKALCFSALYRILNEENMGADVVSGGELFTALRSGFPAERIYFHGNSKTGAEIRYAVERNVGAFIVDNREELAEISACAQELGKRQRILLRVTPGIDPHTFAAVNTGKIDCQFGSPIETGQAMALTKEALETPGVELAGFHCHIGSQIFDWVPYRDAAEKMLRYLAEARRVCGFTARELNLGGGFAVRYVEEDPEIDVEANIRLLGDYIGSRCRALELPLPAIRLEPGRSIVADAGMTVYSVGSVKTIEGYRSYVCVDGGMTDNPRYALYRSAYTVYNVERPGQDADFLCSVAGRCCESGDLIQENILLRRPRRGELVAVAVTGAYNYAMSSNYNRVGRPPIVLLGANGPRLAVRRETWEDMALRDATE